MVLLTAYIGQPFTSLAMETVKTHGAFGRVRNVLGEGLDRDKGYGRGLSPQGERPADAVEAVSSRAASSHGDRQLTRAAAPGIGARRPPGTSCRREHESGRRLSLGDNPSVWPGRVA